MKGVKLIGILSIFSCLTLETKVKEESLTISVKEYFQKVETCLHIIENKNDSLTYSKNNVIEMLRISNSIWYYRDSILTNKIRSHYNLKNQRKKIDLLKKFESVFYNSIQVKVIEIYKPSAYMGMGMYYPDLKIAVPPNDVKGSLYLLKD